MGAGLSASCLAADWPRYPTHSLTILKKGSPMPQSQQPSPPESMCATGAECCRAAANPVGACPITPPEGHPGFALAVAWRDRYAPKPNALRNPDGSGRADDDHGLLRGFLDDIGKSYWHDPLDPGQAGGEPLSSSGKRKPVAEAGLGQCHVTPIDMTLIMRCQKRWTLFSAHNPPLQTVSPSRPGRARPGASV